MAVKQNRLEYVGNKLIYKVIIVVLFACIFVMFPLVGNAKGLNFFCFEKRNIIVTLKNEANVDVSKEKISKIPNIKITKTIYRDEEWSKMVNKMDLPNMPNPFKNEFIIRINKNADMNEIYGKIKEMDFVENVKYVLDTKSVGK